MRKILIILLCFAMCLEFMFSLSGCKTINSNIGFKPTSSDTDYETVSSDNSETTFTRYQECYNKILSLIKTNDDAIIKVNETGLLKIAENEDIESICYFETYGKDSISLTLYVPPFSYSGNGYDVLVTCEINIIIPSVESDDNYEFKGRGYVMYPYNYIYSHPVIGYGTIRNATDNISERDINVTYLNAKGYYEEFYKPILSRLISRTLNYADNYLKTHEYSISDLGFNINN